jgi:Uma2 family endonuclease
VRAELTSEDRHPSEAILVVEVAGESLRRDRRVKAAVYARAGIPEYWIVNLEARDVEVLSDPDPATGTYRKARTCGTAETLTSEALPQLAFPVAALFG